MMIDPKGLIRRTGYAEEKRSGGFARPRVRLGETTLVTPPGPLSEGRPDAHGVGRTTSGALRIRSRARIKRASTPSRHVIFLPSSRERAR
jgi:hypothetical protein